MKDQYLEEFCWRDRLNFGCPDLARVDGYGSGDIIVEVRDTGVVGSAERSRFLS